MENTPILRSLVAGGRSSGTGRPTSSTSTARSPKHADEPRGAAFERQVERQSERVRERSQRDGDQRANREERREAKSADELDSRGADERVRRDLEGSDTNQETRQSAFDAASGELANGGEAALETPDASTVGADSGRTRNSGANAAAVSAEAGAAASSAPAGASEGTPSPSTELLHAWNTPSTEAAAGVAGASSDKRGAAGATTGAPNPEATSAVASFEGAYAAGEPTSDAALDAAPAAEAEGADTASGAKLGEGEFNLAKLAGSNGGESALPSDSSRGPGAVDFASRGAERVEVQAPEGKPDTANAALDADGAADVLRQVRLRLSPEMRQAVIQLEPRELGRISIRISVARGVVRAELRAEHATTLEALERHAPELKAALERVGLGAEGFALQLGFDDGPGQRDGFGAAPRDPHDTSTRAPAPERELPDHQMRSLAQRLAAAGGVDTYA